jgi:hypothetical protein
MAVIWLPLAIYITARCSKRSITLPNELKEYDLNEDQMRVGEILCCGWPLSRQTG